MMIVLFPPKLQKLVSESQIIFLEGILPPQKNDNKRSTTLFITLSCSFFIPDLHFLLTFYDFLSSGTLATCGRLLAVEMGMQGYALENERI